MWCLASPNSRKSLEEMLGENPGEKQEDVTSEEGCNEAAEEATEARVGGEGSAVALELEPPLCKAGGNGGGGLTIEGTPLDPPIKPADPLWPEEDVMGW